MLWLSLTYSIVSLVILLGIFIVIAIKQLELRNIAVYYLLGLILSIVGWVLGDMLQIIFSAEKNKTLVLLFSRFATISSMIAMIFALLFARVLTAKRVLNSITVVIAFALFGGVIALTLSSSYKVIETNVDFYKTEADIIWVILDAAMVFFAGSMFLNYLVRQKNIVGKKYKNILNMMIVGVIIAFFVSIILYAIYAIGFVVPLLHLELLSASIGALIISIAMLRGGKEVTYYTSRVYSLHIFEENGISMFSCVFQSGYAVDDQLISGVASAIVSFAAELIGKKAFPYEIDLGEYSLMLAKKGKYIALISAESPTAHLRRSLDKIINEFDPNMSTQEMCDIIEKRICFEPRVLVY